MSRYVAESSRHSDELRGFNQNKLFSILIFDSTQKKISSFKKEICDFVEVAVCFIL